MASSSAKWRALQRRHKWSYDAVRLRQSRLQALIAVEAKFRCRSPSFSKFLCAILELLQLKSTHAQVSALKDVISSFKAFVSSHGSCTCNVQPPNESSCPVSGMQSDAMWANVCVFSGAVLPIFEQTDVKHDESSATSVRADEDGNNCIPVVDNDLGDYATSRLGFQLLVELLFWENSVPLHRGILSCLAILPFHWKQFIEKALACCLQEYGVLATGTRHFVVAAVATSIINLPKPGLLKNILEPFAATITDVVSHGVQSLLQDARKGGRPTPTAMEECQGALSCMYYLLVYFPHKLFTPCVVSDPTKLNHPKIQAQGNLNTAPETEEVSAARKLYSVYNAALDVILDVLQTGSLSRDCCIAAGAGFSAAIQVDASDLELASMLASSLFAAQWSNLAIVTEDRGLLHELKIETPIECAVNQVRGTTLVLEVGKLTEFGRLCVLRGLLTAIPRSVLNMKFLCIVGDKLSTVGAINTKHESKICSWSVLYNGTLPALSELCESSSNSHFKFHAVTALQICLQQIKTSISLGVTASAHEVLERRAHGCGVHVLEHSLLPNSTVQRILQIVWNNWEDPLNQTVKQIQVVFDLLADIQCLLLSGCTGSSPNNDEAVKEMGNDSRSVVKDFLVGILRELLMAGGHRKGRYIPLASLSLRLGALNLVNISPNLLFESIHAMADDDVCCAVGNFLKSFLERLRDDCWNSEGGAMEGIAAFRCLSLPPLIAGMVLGNSRLRININIYALPVLLQIDSDAILPMLAFALHGFLPDGGETMVSWDELKGASGLPVTLTTNQRVALMVGLLKAARLEGLIEGDLCCPEDYAQESLEFTFDSAGMAFVSVKKVVFRMPLAVLEIAVTHSEDSLRVDAAEALCLNLKTSSMPSYLELALLKVSIPLNMRCSSTSFRVKWTSLFRKFLLRIRVSVERQLKTIVASNEADSRDISKVFLEGDIPVCDRPVSLKQMQSFIRWFCNMLLFSIYPSAPYERKNMAMDLIASMMESWSLSNVSLHAVGTGNFLTDDATTVLLGSIVDSWDKLREGAFKILSSYPTPLPGYKSTIEVERALKWAISLVNSPRVRESDAGALVLRLLFQKYVVQLRWIFKLHPLPLVSCPQLSVDSDRAVNEGIAIATYVESLNDWLEWGIQEGENNLLKACRHSFVHGVLLSYRYTIEELEWNSNSLIDAVSELRKALNRLLHLLTRVTSIALWVVSADAFDMSQGLHVESKPSNIDLQGLLEDDEMSVTDDWIETSFEQAGGEGFGFLAPSDQAIMVGCWLAMKEVSLLLGTVARKVPLPGCNQTDLGEDGFSSSILDLNQLELIGGHFLQVLLSMKHNGAIDKTKPGFVALCNRLLCSNDARLNKMPELWLYQLMDRTASKGQTVDDLLRRSAGIPAAFLALFLSEPEGAPKTLLLIAMRWIIDLIKSSLEGSQSDNIGARINAEHNCATSLRLVKERDEGVVPTVHAFNVLRVTFNDTNLSSDCSGFCAEGLIVAIQAFSSHHWEVRNAAMLAFTALLRRMVGFLNDQTHEAARRAMTGFEFFHRYPSLHSFLLKELQNAASQLQDERGDHTGVNCGNLSRTLHPSLAPVLIILSRLKPSIINTNKDDWLSPSAFTSYVSKCATQSNLKVRMLSSRALAPLVVSDQLRFVLLELVNFLTMNGASLLIKSSGGGHDSFPMKLLPFNTIHGILLQLHALLKYNCKGLPANSELRKEISCLLLPFLTRINKHTLFRCPLVGAAFLQVLKSLLGVHKMCRRQAFPDPLHDLLVESSALVLDGQYGAFSHHVGWDPSYIIMKVKACKYYFKEILKTWHFDASDEVFIPVQADTSQQRMINKFLGRLRDCLCSVMYEIRLTVLKVLKGFFGSLEPNSYTEESIKLPLLQLNWAASSIHPLILKRLKEETHPRCLRYVLLNHFIYSMLQLKIQRVAMEFVPSSNIRKDFIFSDELLNCFSLAETELWELFVQVYNNARHGQTREVALCCLGLCIRQITQCMRNPSILKLSGGFFCHEWRASFSLVEESLQFWLKLIQRHSRPSEPVMLRRASADAIVASGILEQVPWAGTHQACKDFPLSSQCGVEEKKSDPRKDFPLSSQCGVEEKQNDPRKVCSVKQKIAGKVLDVWYICLKLLEDEDVVLREKLAVAVLQIVSSVSHIRLGDDFVPAQVERVIHLSFTYLSLHLSQSGAYVECLATWVWMGLTDMDITNDNCNLVRRLFDKEADNHHEEGLFFTQLCFLHIWKSLAALHSVSTSSGNLAFCSSAFNISELWRERFLCRLRSFLEKLCSLESKLQWLGGPTNHPDVFKSLYPLLLGVLVFSGPVDSVSKVYSEGFTKEKAAGLVEVVKMLKGFVNNPLLSSLLILLMRQHGLQDMFTLKFQENVLSENFSPFFLL